MRKITKKARDAFYAKKPFSKSNTTVVVETHATIMYLYGNPIAIMRNDKKNTILISNCGWKTATTKERLNALDGVHIVQRQGIWYLNDKEWNGELIEIQ